MTTVNTLLARATHPQRKPFVRSCTFTDGIGPPPWTFYDETQDHLGAFYGGALGWKYSVLADEFEAMHVRPGYLGNRMLTVNSSGVVTIAPKTTGLEPFEHGVWKVTGGAAAWNYAARTQQMDLDGDFLVTAKIKIYSRETLDTMALGGFMLPCSDLTSIPAPVGFTCGSDSPNWHVLYPPDATASVAAADTGIPATSNAWYRLQVSRVAGAVRWFINGRLCTVNGLPGYYFPDRFGEGCKQIRISRRKIGAAGEGFEIDSFHLVAERSAS